MFEAARVGDDIGHSGALAGMIAGTIVGGLIAAAGGIAAGALFLAGLGAATLGVGVLLIGASLAVGYLTGEIATAARDKFAEDGAASMTKKGTIMKMASQWWNCQRTYMIGSDTGAECLQSNVNSIVKLRSRKWLFLLVRASVRRILII